MKLSYWLGCIALASLLTAAPALGQEATVSSNIAIATDFTFRGLSQTDSHPAVQGGFDATFANSGFYVGAWASNVDFGFSDSIELDLYGGYRFTTGPVALDVGIIDYLYPSAADDGLSQGTGELDYVEGYVKASAPVTKEFTLAGAAYYSPEFTGETGKAFYLEINGAFVASPELSFSGAVGYQSIDDVTGVFAGSLEDDYATWNIGGSYSVLGLAFDLSYVGTSIDSTDAIVLSAFTSAQKADDRIVLSVKKAL